jgi:tetratricopeptide (TPR) repeat protein
MRRRLIILFIFCSTALLAQNPGTQLIDAYGKLAMQAYPDAVSAFELLISGNHAPPADWYLRKGMAEFGMGSYHSAAEDFSKASAGNIPEADLWNARVQVLSGNQKQAILLLDNYLKHAENPDEEAIKKDSLFLSLHTSPDWFTLWQNDYRSDKQKLQEEVKYYIRKKDFERAHSAIDEALSNLGDDASLHFINSGIYDAEGNYQLALNEINIALTAGSENLLFLHRKADLLMKLSKYPDAVVALTTILNHSPEDFEARFMRSRAALMSGNYTMAKADISIYVTYFKTDDSQFLASQIFFKSGSPMEALKYINPLLEKDGSNASWFKLRGMIYYDSQTFDQSAYDLSMSLDLFPDDAEANYYLGLAEQKLGNNILACYYMKRAKRFGELKSVSFLQDHCEK